MSAPIQIGTRPVGAGEPVLVIAEAGVNHNGDLGRARELVREAAAAGADCVKFQTFRAERVVTRTAPKAAYQLEQTDPGESQLDMLRCLELDRAAHGALIALCRSEGVLFLSTPYNREDVDLLDALGAPAFKLASIHCAEPTFIAEVARRGKPVLLSTGMATIREVREAVAAARETGNDQIVLLQCTTQYPAAPRDANLRAIESLAREFDLPVGYSDHTPGTALCHAAVALGACAIEKHFTLDRSLPGPDHASSADPAELRALVGGLREVEAALGDGIKRPCAVERANAPGMRRSIALARDLPAGHPLRDEDLRFMRPATGIPPRELPKLLGRRTRRPLRAGTLLAAEDCET